MNRLLRLGILPLAVLLLLLGLTGFAAAQNSTAASSGNPTPPPPFLPELEGIPPEQLFDHFRSAQFTITDAQGNAVVYEMTPGTVAAVSGTSLTITPNGATTATTFMITENTIVRAMPARGSLQALANGDKVVVLNRQGIDEAVLVAKHKPGAMRGFHRGMYGM